MIPEPADLADGLQETWDEPVSFESGMLLSWMMQEGRQAERTHVPKPYPLIGWCQFWKTLPPERAEAPLRALSYPITKQARFTGPSETYLLVKHTHPFP